MHEVLLLDHDSFLSFLIRWFHYWAYQNVSILRWFSIWNFYSTLYCLQLLRLIKLVYVNSICWARWVGNTTTFLYDGWLFLINFLLITGHTFINAWFTVLSHALANLNVLVLLVDDLICLALLHCSQWLVNIHVLWLTNLNLSFELILLQCVIVWFHTIINVWILLLLSQVHVSICDILV